MMKFNLTFFSIVLFFGCTTPEIKSELTTFHGGPARTGVYSGESFERFDTFRWSVKTDGKVFSSPALADGTLFVGSEDENLYAIDIAAGKVNWKFKTGGAIHSSPAIHESKVFFGSFDGHYYAVDIETGMETWNFKTGGESLYGAIDYFGLKPEGAFYADPWQYYLSSPLVSTVNGAPMVFFGSSDSHVYALNAEDGHLIWKYRTEGPVHSSPALYEGKIYIGSWDAVVYALDAATGNLLWKFQTGQQPGMTGVQASPAVANNTVYIGARDAKFYALDAGTGVKKWEYSADNSWVLTTAAVKGDNVYIGTSDSYRFVALDALTGREKFHFKTNGYVYSSPAISGNTAFFGDFTGKIFAVNLESNGAKYHARALESRSRFANEILRGDTLDFAFVSYGKDLSYYQTLKVTTELFYQLGSILSSPVISDGSIYFGSADGNIYAISLE